MQRFHFPGQGFWDSVGRKKYGFSVVLEPATDLIRVVLHPDVLEISISSRFSQLQLPTGNGKQICVVHVYESSECYRLCGYNI